MFKYLLIATMILAGCRGSYQTTHQCNGYNVWEVSQEASAAIAEQRRTARATACEIVRDAQLN